MTISMYTMSVEAFIPALQSLSGLLDRAAEHAKAKSLDPAVLTKGKLAPDMFDLVKQVHVACGQANDAVAWLKGAEPKPSNNTEHSLKELKALIGKTIAGLQAVRPAEFDGAEQRPVNIRIPDFGIQFNMNGLEYLRDWALPNFYFHVATAYDILRHAGVELGKKDYLAHTARYISPLPKG